MEKCVNFNHLQKCIARRKDYDCTFCCRECPDETYCSDICEEHQVEVELLEDEIGDVRECLHCGSTSFETHLEPYGDDIDGNRGWTISVLSCTECGVIYDEEA